MDTLKALESHLRLQYGYGQYLMLSDTPVSLKVAVGGLLGSVFNGMSISQMILVPGCTMVCIQGVNLKQL